MLPSENKTEKKVNANSGAEKRHKIFTIIGIILCVILVPMLIVNCTLIIKSFIDPDEVPDFAGVVPLIVLTDSMYPDIEKGDLIFTQTANADEIEIGDTISFTDPDGNGVSIVTHMVIDKFEHEGVTYFRTKGINNNTEDKASVPEDLLIGKYTGVRLPGFGHVALFMQEPYGLILCVVVPIILFVGYDIIRRRLYEKKNEDDVDALKAELEALRAAKAQAAEAPAEEVAEEKQDDNPTEN